MNWYQVKARLERVQDDGSQKIVSENYLVQAFSFGMAEGAIQKEIAPFASGEFDIISVARKNYSEVIESSLGNEIADKWYKCKVNLVTLNERSGKEKKTSQFFLVNANTAMAAHELVDEFMMSSVSNYEVEQVDETKILEVFKVASKDDE